LICGKKILDGGRGIFVVLWAFLKGVLGKAGGRTRSVAGEFTVNARWLAVACWLFLGGGIRATFLKFIFGVGFGGEAGFSAARLTMVP
jgi:hypothetical protein